MRGGLEIALPTVERAFVVANAQFSPTASSTNASAARVAKKGKTNVKTLLPKGR
jgi:hypothetical protein